MPPNQHWFCALGTAILWTSSLCSSLFIVSMTFDRSYSIIRPHKAAGFNTVKRAKITVVCIVLFSIAFNVPQLYTITNVGRQCVPDLTEVGKTFYYWLSYVFQFAIPFVLLLTMNSVIIHTLRKRSAFTTRCESQDQDQGHGQKSNMKTSEKQIYAMLLLVAFSFFILITPLYVFILYSSFVDYKSSPKAFAGFYLFYNVMHKMYYTNNAINFFLYVISGQKFRMDLVKLFRFKKYDLSFSNVSESNARISSIGSTISIPKEMA